MNINEAFYCSRCLREMEDEGVCPFCGYDEDETLYDPQVLEEGTLLGNRRYRIGALIGSGGFGMTYAAWDQTLLTPVAIKEYFPMGFADRDVGESNDVQIAEEERIVFATGLTTFNREAHILAALQNVPHVVKVYDCFEENGTGYIVMEYVRGMTLLEYVQKHSISSGELLKMLREPISSLAQIHQQGVMHRDITPNNLMVQEDGTIKLIDFGAASVDESRIKGRNLSISATKHYAAPEQYDPKLQQGQWTDVYGLSATIYALLTGSEPPDSKERMRRDTLVPPRKVNSSLSKRQENAILKGLTVDPKNRLRSVDEFQAILYNLPTPEIVRQKKRIMRKMLLIMAAAALLTLLVIVNFAVGLPLGDGLRYALHSEGWHIIAAKDVPADLEIPENLLLIPVTQIGDKAFEGETALTSVSIPGSVYRMGEQAFYGCTALEQVYMADGTEEIGDLAFSGCTSLHTVYAPSSAIFLGERMFLDTPSYLTVWGSHGDAMGIDIAAENVLFADRSDFEIRTEQRDGREVAVLTAYRGIDTDLRLPSFIDGMPLVAIDEEVAPGMFPENTYAIAFPYYLERIPAGLFGGSVLGEDVYFELREAVLGPHVREIGAYAFAGTDLEVINLPEGLERIEDCAFMLTMLKAIDIPQSVTYVGEQSFAGADLETLTLPAGERTYGEFAFMSNDYLREVILPDGMEVISHTMFASCEALERVVVPESVRRIETGAFNSCISLEMINLEGVQEIGQLAFGECINLKYIYLPADTLDINDHAFDGCSKELVLSGYDASYIREYASAFGFEFENQNDTAYEATRSTLQEGIMLTNDHIVVLADDPTVIWPISDTKSGELNKSIHQSWHYYGELKEECRYNPEKVILPKYAERIESSAYYAEVLLREVVFPEKLTFIGRYAFGECVSLAQLDLPDTLRDIDSYAFENCTSLEHVTLPEGLLRLGYNAFEGCKNLRSVDLPKKMTMLSNEVFTGSGLETVTIPGNIRVCHNAFLACPALKRAVMEEGVYILMDTFKDCTALETVIIPATMNTISDNTFKNCTALKDVYFYSRDCVFSYTIDGEGGAYPLEDVLALAPEVIDLFDRPFKDLPDLTVHGYPGSTIEAYCKAFGINFVPLEEIKM